MVARCIFSLASHSLINDDLNFGVKFEEDSQAQLFGVFINSVHIYCIDTFSKEKF